MLAYAMKSDRCCVEKVSRCKGTEVDQSQHVILTIILYTFLISAFDSTLIINKKNNSFVSTSRSSSETSTQKLHPTLLAWQTLSLLIKRIFLLQRSFNILVTHDRLLTYHCTYERLKVCPGTIRINLILARLSSQRSVIGHTYSKGHFISGAIRQQCMCSP